MSTLEAVTTQKALVDAALRLVEEHPDIAAGSVLRSFSRAVVLMRRARTPSRHLAPRAELLTHQLLASRHQGLAWDYLAPRRRDAAAAAATTSADAGREPRSHAFGSLAYIRP